MRAEDWLRRLSARTVEYVLLKALVSAGLRFGLARRHRPDPLLNESQLRNRQRAKNERVEIILAHAAIDRVDRECERQPSVDDVLHIIVARMEIEYRARTLRQLGTDLQAGKVRCFERVDHMKVMRPRFREVLPGVRACVGGDEMLRPIGRDVYKRQDFRSATDPGDVASQARISSQPGPRP